MAGQRAAVAVAAAAAVVDVEPALAAWVGEQSLAAGRVDHTAIERESQYTAAEAGLAADIQSAVVVESRWVGRSLGKLPAVVSPAAALESRQVAAVVPGRRSWAAAVQLGGRHCRLGTSWSPSTLFG